MEEQAFSLTVYYANQRGSPQNCLYPYWGTARTTDELKPLVANDHVFIQFADNRRAKDNFIQAKYAVFDCDNDHSDDPADWINLDDIPRLLPEVRCIIYTSRSHMKQKGTKSERPRFHNSTQPTAGRPDNASGRWSADPARIAGLYRH